MHPAFPPQVSLFSKSETTAEKNGCTCKLLLKSNKGDTFIHHPEINPKMTDASRWLNREEIGKAIPLYFLVFSLKCYE